MLDLVAYVIGWKLARYNVPPEQRGRPVFDSFDCKGRTIK